MYYFMEQDTERTRGYMLTRIPPATRPRNRWLDGARFGTPPDGPVPFELDPVVGTRMVDFFQADIPVFAAPLLERFRALGVDNLDAYPAVLVEPDSRKQWTDYFAVNVIGVIGSAAAAAAGSETAPAGGFLCFRLLEDLSRIVVHHRVVSRIPLAEFRGLRFTELEAA
jgi:hypothetical protein